MRFFSALSVIYISLLTLVSSLPTPTPGYVEPQTTTYEPVRWLTHFGAVIPSDTVVKLEWEGGSGKGYEVYYIPQWDGQADYHMADIVTTTETHYDWHTPKSSTFPKGTTFIVGISDLDSDSPDFGSEWYDLTGLIEFGK